MATVQRLKVEGFLFFYYPVKLLINPHQIQASIFSYSQYSERPHSQLRSCIPNYIHLILLCISWRSPFSFFVSTTALTWRTTQSTFRSNRTFRLRITPTLHMKKRLVHILFERMPKSMHDPPVHSNTHFYTKINSNLETREVILEDLEYEIKLLILQLHFG